MLQALATQKILDDLGYDNETVCIDGLKKEINRSKAVYFAKAALTSDFLAYKVGKLLNKVRVKLGDKEFVRNTSVRHETFQKYKMRSFRVSDRMDSLDLFGEYCKKNYSTVLVGSDQLWLPANIAADYYTLNKVPDGINKIAYATSFGQSVLPGNIRKKAMLFLNRIDHISVREHTGQKIVKKETGRRVPLVCDPTLLFTGDEWLKIQKVEPIRKGKYIFCYFLGNNPEHRVFARKLKEKTGCRIISLIHLPEYKKCDIGYADETPYDIDPADFINLIRNARYVCTDSFHCCVFSILYRKQFFAFRRYTKDTKISTNSRLDTLFKVTGIQNKILKGTEKIDENLFVDINFDHVFERLEKFRKKSLRYLTDSIKDEKGTDL